MACMTILKKKTCLGSWSICGGSPAVALHLMNTADYPTLPYPTLLVVILRPMTHFDVCPSSDSTNNYQRNTCVMP